MVEPNYDHTAYIIMKGWGSLMNSTFMEMVTELAVNLFKKTTFVHEFYVHKNRLKACFGIKIKKLFSAIVTVKSKEKVTIVTFNVNGCKYRLYLATGKLLTAIRVTLLYIKARVTKDTKLMKRINAVTLNHKEYKAMQLNKKQIVKSIEKRADANEAKGKKPDGPLVIKLGRTGPSPKFDKAAAATW